ncbi:NUDIX hydrolase [Lacrimispora sp. 210928-DFI.3.58]|uniref:NUDIX hydrolase n=1 Tax=Lacrimispora sp. 210928-DFI.3.58 TaxID=2883214 RepID=UPI001D0708FC|nr:NUDIX hydrolase [Lacrimispora sp. 210928-DFI.3.58]MCB7319802.1 NUDIX hydrolase [Lacrimispora sp. 210928-DFI.3.58]
MTEKILPAHIVATAGVVLNENGEVLLVNTYQDSWVLPGGEVEVGENLVDAVKREIFEESGIEVEVGEVFCISSNTCTYPGYNGVKTVPTKVIFDFICKEKSGILRGSDENSVSAWVPQDQVLDLIKAPSNRVRFQAFLEYSGRPIYLEYITKPVFELKGKRTF